MTNFKKIFTDKSVFQDNTIIHQAPIEIKIEEDKEINNSKEIVLHSSVTIAKEPKIQIRKKIDPKPKEYSKPKELDKTIFKFNIIFLGILIILVVGSLLFSAGVLYSIKAPDINAESLVLSNEDAILKSKKPFYIKLNNKTIHSIESNNLHNINLGKLEGKNKVIVGGINKLGWITVEGLITKANEINRDYTPIEIVSEIKKYYEPSNTTFSIQLTKPETNFKVMMNNQEYFSSSNPNENCNFQEPNLNCKINFESANTKQVKIELIDQVGNKSTVIDTKLELLNNSTLNCNKSEIEKDGLIKCNPNFEGEAIINDTLIPVKAGIQFEYPKTLPDGKQVIKYTIKTNKSITKNYQEEYTVDKQLLELKFNTVVDETKGSAQKPLITLQVTSTTDTTLNSSGSYIEIVNKSKKLINYKINNQFQANQNGVISSEIYDDSKGENTVYILKFTNNAGRVTNFKCIRNYNVKEFECIKN